MATGQSRSQFAVDPDLGLSLDIREMVDEFYAKFEDSGEITPENLILAVNVPALKRAGDEFKPKLFEKPPKWDDPPAYDGDNRILSRLRLDSSGRDARSCFKLIPSRDAMAVAVRESELPRDNILICSLTPPEDGRLDPQRIRLFVEQVLMISCFSIIFRNYDKIALVIGVFDSYAGMGDVPPAPAKLIREADGELVTKDGSGRFKGLSYAGAVPFEMYALKLGWVYRELRSRVVDWISYDDSGLPPLPSDVLRALSFGNASEKDMDEDGIPIHPTPLMLMMLPTLAAYADLFVWHVEDEKTRKAGERMMAYPRQMWNLGKLYAKMLDEVEGAEEKLKDGMSRSEAVEYDMEHQTSGMAKVAEKVSQGINSFNSRKKDGSDDSRSSGQRRKNGRIEPVHMDAAERRQAWEEAAKAGLPGSCEFFWAWWRHFGMDSIVEAYFAGVPVADLLV